MAREERRTRAGVSKECVAQRAKGVGGGERERRGGRSRLRVTVEGHRRGERAAHTRGTSSTLAIT